MNVQVTNISPIHVVMLRHVGPYEEVGGVFEKLYAFLEANGIPTQRTIGIYYDNPDFVEARALRSAACAEIHPGQSIPDSGALRLDVEDIAGGDYATTRYVGPYEQM